MAPLAGAAPSRRAVLAGLAGLALARPLRAASGAGAESLEAILARSGLGARSGFILADLDGGGVLETYRAERPFPPASVAKIITALYALDTLGDGYRFRTRVASSARDMALIGDGDPTLDSDALAALAADARRSGTPERLFTAARALPEISMIDRDQPPLAVYNPAISGLNLNYNRALLSRTPDGLAVTAMGDRADIPVAVPAFTLTNAAAPRWSDGPAGEIWRIPKAKLAGRGGLWLPVRAPAPYAASAFAALLGGGPAPSGAAPAGFAGDTIAEHLSDPAVEMVRAMLFHSTNLTAEALGLRASQARGAEPDRLADSAGMAREWARSALGLEKVMLVNHSGLSDANRVAPVDLLGVLVRAEDKLRDLLRRRALAGGTDDPGLAPDRARLLCKTGTLDFVSALAGYLDTAGRRLAFVIFSADLEARARIPQSQRDDPPGAKAWERAARGQQRALLRRWVEAYGG